MNNSKRIFFKLEKVEGEIALEHNFEKDEEKNVYIMGIASTEDENSAGFVVENKALLEAWNNNKSNGKNVAVYEKHSYPVGKVVSCEEYNDKILVVMEIPKQGNDRVLAVYNQGVYVGLSIGGWSLDGTWDKDTYHVTDFDWYEVSLTDVPANENATLLEQALASKPIENECKKKLEDEEEEKDEEDKDEEKEKTEEECKKELEKDVMVTLEKVKDLIRGIN